MRGPEGEATQPHSEARNTEVRPPGPYPTRVTVQLRVPTLITQVYLDTWGQGAKQSAATPTPTTQKEKTRHACARRAAGLSLLLHLLQLEVPRRQGIQQPQKGQYAN